MDTLASPAEHDVDRRAWVLAALEQYEGRLLRYAQRLSDGRLDEARDAVQHTFMRLCDESPAKVDDRLAAWLFTVCRNRLIDGQRANGRLHALGDIDHDEPGREPDPAALSETLDDSEQVRRVVATLPAKQQDAVNLWSEGFSYREIGQIAGHTEGHVRVLVHRAFQTIRQHPVIRRLISDDASTAPTETGRLSPAGQ